ncbi:CPBP family intramembrane glutamic endopeptidase [Lacticaseibacillus daqingensis]|uniref:CPBP family intramembrane glutamic endopeptidase n=1 Tax=Lacticaseibacillus daqingensis TaxID=2486014 RepID=UPI000F7681FA|nr:CPBP family intramembrane glutamic endopeptidase [Lacticaseibacillus daqingensis]
MNKVKIIQHRLGEGALVFLIAIGWAALSGIGDIVLGVFQVNVRSLPLNFYLLSMLYCEGIAVLAMLVRYRQRPLLLGTSNSDINIDRDYLWGLLLGGIVFTVIWALILIQGGYALSVVFKASHLWLIVLYLFGFMIQSLFEELVCRGYVMGYWLEQGHVLTAVLLNALLFMGLHLGNPGFNKQAALGIFLFGILMSLVRLACGSIWMGAGFHAIWNFFEGIVFGTAVSGLPNIGLIVKSSATANNPLASGGVFGLESSTTSIVVHLIAIAAVLFIIQNSGPKGSFSKRLSLNGKGTNVEARDD